MSQSATVSRALEPGHYVSAPFSLQQIKESYASGIQSDAYLLKWNRDTERVAWRRSYFGSHAEPGIRCDLDVICPDPDNFEAVIMMIPYPFEEYRVREALEEIEEQEGDPDSVGKFFLHLQVL